jgi:hypothetical protein
MTDRPRWLVELEERIERGEVPTYEPPEAEAPRSTRQAPERDSNVTAFPEELIERLERLHVTVDVRAVARRILARHQRQQYASPDGALVSAVRRAWLENTDQRQASDKQQHTAKNKGETDG